jgi:putative Mg2+ transporter-C (MgtC) family protein
MVLGIMLSGQEYGGTASIDPSRIASTVVQGIGFIAGGVIFTIGARVQGLTTAAGIWVAAAAGLLIGGGFYIVGFGAVIMSLVVLRVLGAVGHRLPTDHRALERRDLSD